MLVLSRKKNQTIIIDSQIEIEVLQVRGNTVRIGIKAPADKKILRGELQPVELQLTGDSDETDSAVQERRGGYRIGTAALPVQVLSAGVGSEAIPA